MTVYSNVLTGYNGDEITTSAEFNDWIFCSQIYSIEDIELDVNIQ